MSLFSTNRFKNISAEYVEESMKAIKEEDETTVVPDDSKPLDVKVDETIPDDKEFDSVDDLAESALDEMLSLLNNF